MKFGIYVHTHGPLADVAGLADLAAVSAEFGWDGFFIWDALFHEGIPVVDTQVTLGAIGLATADTNLKFGALVTPLARRRPWKVAKELASLDQLAPGRVVCGAGIGDGTDFELVSSEPQSPKERAVALEDNLAILKELLAGGTSWIQSRDHAGTRENGEPKEPLELRASSPFLPVPEARIPIWGSALVQRRKDLRQPKRPFRRAASRMDGLFPIEIDGNHFTPDACLSPDELRQVIEWAEGGSAGQALKPGFDLVVRGRVYMENSPADLKGLEQAGLTWWLEAVPEDMPLEEVRAVIQKGPPST